MSRRRLRHRGTARELGRPQHGGGGRRVGVTTDFETSAATAVKDADEAEGGIVRLKDEEGERGVQICASKAVGSKSWLESRCNNDVFMNDVDYCFQH